MPYYVTAFCTGIETPTIQTVVRALNDLGFRVHAQLDDNGQLESSAWQRFDLVYRPDKKPIIVECVRDDGESSLVRRECEYYIAELTALDIAGSRDAVVDHLRRTHFIIVCQLLSDIDDDGYDANAEFLGYFVKHCGGMIHADGEGFYDSNENLILEFG